MVEFKDIIPEGMFLDDEMPDKAKEGYYSLVSIGNSLNSLHGLCRRKASYAIAHNNKQDAMLFDCLAYKLEQAQKIINILCDETGRTKAFEEWRDKSDAKIQNLQSDES